MKVHFTRGNLNNHIGVPLTLLSAPAGVQLMIVEMGANHIGEIRTLCLIAKPDYGIITNIGNAHMEGFGSFEGVVKAKTELYEYLRKVNGIALYNDKNHLITEKIFRMVNRAVPYSDPTGTDLNIELVSSEMTLTLSVDYQHKKQTLKTNLFGKYNLENVRAAIATSLFLGAEMTDIIKAVEKYVPGNNRSQVKITANNTLICDSYNANPDSMRKAIESFAEIKAGKKLLILGDMLELGDKANEEHLNILRILNTYGIDEVLLVGRLFGILSPGFGYKSFGNADALKDYLKSNPVKGYHVLVKGSNGIMLEKIYDLL
jgi:UDP-N-acetylmuramoyl-tripeptide--D-alanyl-D-alanine ligase